MKEPLTPAPLPEQRGDSVQSIGQAMHNLAGELYPICRSITGNGVRQTLNLLQRIIPLEIHEVPSGLPAFDWTVPNEWNIKEAWVKNPAGERVIDFARHNLHVLNYSTPIHQHISLEELKPHLFSLPGQPDLIPYRTSYYALGWGFCLPHAQLEQMEPGQYLYADANGIVVARRKLDVD